MANLNKVMLIGRFPRDPELRVTPKGVAICTFSLAVNHEYTDANKEKHEEVCYVDIEAWNKQGETISKYCTKGMTLFVEGRLRLDQWEDKTTKEKRSKMKVVLTNFQFLDKKGDNNSAQAPAYSSSPKPAPSTQENLDEDIPF